ncbi:MAG: type I-E CRISPR-associated protein Cas7/Cse4/CasC [Pyrinomonadaceae bacterium]
MFIELHILQNFAPSNLNRDETGAPKSCQFGDVQRARVSSQALKRAARDYVEDKELLDPNILGKRTKLVEEKLKQILVKRFEKDENQAGFVANLVLKESGWKKESEKDESGALQFLGNKSLNDIAVLCNEDWDSFQELIDLNNDTQKLSQEKKTLAKEKKSLDTEINKNPTSELQEQLTVKENEIKENGANLERIESFIKEAQKKMSNLIKKVRESLGAKQTPDIAMFGRMMADVPEHNIDAASQVAHAISTHAVSNGEFDYFTALDEFKKELKPNESGAAMIGTVDFNSACYYRYANIDTNCLEDNLVNADNAKDLARKTVEAFLQSFVIAVPSGKQNSFASPTLPTFVLGIVREGYLCSLANAFSKPIRLQDDDENGLVEKSIQQLTKHFFNKERMYGEIVGTKYSGYCSESNDEFVSKPKENSGEKTELKESDSLKELIDKLISQAFDQSNGG